MCECVGGGGGGLEGDVGGGGILKEQFQYEMKSC